LPVLPSCVIGSVASGHDKNRIGKNLGREETIQASPGIVQPMIRFVVCTWCPLLVALLVLVQPQGMMANPQYAAVTMDARDGRVMHSRNADTHLHPASLTKMMTLYLVFEAIEKGEVDVDQKVLISAKAAAEPSSKVYLKQGDRYTIRYLIRAAAIRSANDAATALAEAISGSEEAFVSRMNTAATAMGLRSTVFKNAHGLTEIGHFSTARDMANLGRRLIYDYPGYYNIFSRRSTMIGDREIYNTNRVFLNSVKGADGIKTGYTRAAGFNQVVSAERGGVRLVVTMFGGRSVADRNNRVAKLLEDGFKNATPHVVLVRPKMPLIYDSQSHVTKLLSYGVPLLRPGLPGKPAVEERLDDRETSHVEAILADVTNRSVESPTGERPPQGDVPSVASDAGPPVEAAADVAEIDEGLLPAGISLGKFGTMNNLIARSTKAKLITPGTLFGAKQVVVKERHAFHLKFVGLSANEAHESCLKIKHRKYTCDVYLVE